MTDITIFQLHEISPHIKNASNFIDPLNACMSEFSIDTPARKAAFIANILHESAYLSHLEENFNYTPQGILTTFNTPKVTRFTFDQAYRLGRTIAHKADQVAIANIAYANRMGNGPIESGDGWRHRGSGCIALTGKENQQACAKYFGIDLEAIGDWLRTPEGACGSAGWFWHVNGINELADAGDFDKVCDKVNIGRLTKAIGDTNGYAERLALFKQTKSALS